MARTCSACSRQQCGVPTAPTSNSLRTRGPTQMTTLAGHGAGAGYLIFMLRGWAAPMPIRWRPRLRAQRTASTPRAQPSGAASQLGLSQPPAQPFWYTAPQSRPADPGTYWSGGAMDLARTVRAAARGDLDAFADI